MNKYSFSIRRKFTTRVFSILVVLLLYIPNKPVFAQKAEPAYRRYTVDDGLPSSMVYHAFQDSKGYIWFATANGVSRFNGYKFENFDLQSGLVDNDVFEIYEDYKHRIWFIPMSGKLCYFDKGEIFSYKYNNLIEKKVPNSRGPIKGSFYVDSLDFVYLSIRQFDRICISPDGIYKTFANNPEFSIDAIEIKEDKILISTLNTPYGKIVGFKGINNSFEIALEKIIGNPYATHHHLFIIPMHDSSTLLSICGNLVRIDESEIISRKTYGEEIIWTSVDRRGNIWNSAISGGIQCFDSKKKEFIPKFSLLENVKVTSVLLDNEGAYWYTTLNDGVFYCSDINILNYNTGNNLSDNRVNAIQANKMGTYIGYEFAFVDLLKNGIVKHYSSPRRVLPKNSVRSFLTDTSLARLWVCSIVNLNYIENEQVTEMGLTPSHNTIYPKKIIKSKMGGYWVATTRGLVYLKNNVVNYESYIKNDFKGVVYDLIEDNQNRVWFCTINGIWTYYNGSFEHLGKEEPRLANTTYSILINPIDSSYWFGTNGAGIILKRGSKITQITTADGLVSNSISHLYFADNNVWVATRNGLSRIIIDDNKYSIKNFTKANGLPTNEVTSVCEFRDSVFVGTTQGLAVFNKNSVEECLTPPKIIISSLKVNDKEIDLTKPNLFFTYDQNSLSVDFVGFVYRNAGKVNYRYRMIGVDTSWVYTQTPNCQYNGLSDGDYRFEVEAQSYNGIWSDKPATSSFSIHPPFWKRTWFLTLIILSFTGLFFIAYRIRINSIHRRSELMQNINLYKQQSLRQQMNPHFIFNTLNSIQLYILEKDSISSHKYLTKFARLMRLTLDNSLYSTIPLKDEIEALRLYLDLEKLRLEDRFDYTIDYGANNNMLNFEVPTLLIQPFVENAIWHGISLRKDQMGWVKIILIDNGNTLTCVIEDNGVGRAMADQIRKSRNKEHKSRGSQITQQRIDLLAQMYKEKFSIIYNDLLDSSGTPLGTRVSVTIPKDIKVNLHK